MKQRNSIAPPRAVSLTEENDSVRSWCPRNRRISVVADGQIERGIDADALRTRLRSLVLQRRAGVKRTAPLYT